MCVALTLIVLIIKSVTHVESIICNFIVSNSLSFSVCTFHFNSTNIIITILKMKK